MMSNKIEQLSHQDKDTNLDVLDLMKFLTKFQKIERHIFLTSLNRFENDTEHSYNLAMAAWTIINKEELPLNVNLVIKYALVHDLVEIYAGDTFAFDDEALKSKPARELEALNILKSDNLTVHFAQTAEEYEKLDNEESKFVYGLDKLMAFFTIVNDGHNQHDITKEMFIERFQAKVEQSIYLQPYWQTCLQLFDNNPWITSSQDRP